MPRLRRVMPASLITGALLVAIPASAPGAVTIGSDLASTATLPRFCAPDPCTQSQLFLPLSSQAAGGLLAPSDGVVVRWRINVGATTTPVALRVTRPGDSKVRTGAGTGPSETPPANQTSTFDVRLPIRAGDALAIDCCEGANLSAFATTSDATLGSWLPALVDGEAPRDTFLSDAFDDLELLMNADIEPDADGDGFGDETQDGCPTDASTQAECDPPETEITRAPANKSAKSKAKYKFRSDEEGSTFECKLKGKGLRNAVKRFGDCDSPRKYKGLDEGKFKFQVRAIDEAGNVDPTPAKDRFKVVG